MTSKHNVNENGEIDGESISYYKNGQLESKGNYFNKERHGNWEFYWYTGQLQSKGTYKEGKYDGEWKEYVDSHLHSVFNYKEGILEGESECHFSNGLLNWKGNYKNGKEEGEWNYYDLYGNISEKGHYSNGVRYGLWQENGQIVSHYNDGQGISTEREKQENSIKEKLIEKTTAEAQSFFFKYLIIGLILIGLLTFLILR
ncbi:MAG: hypothetical protein V4511_04805 [Bacteroidota bacterium]